jgi:hypothetical protein
MSYEEISGIYGTEEAYRAACEKLAAIPNIKEQCGRAGAEYDEDSNRITVAYLNRQHVLTFSDCQISPKDQYTDAHEEITAMDKTLIVHYLTLAKGIALSGKLVTYKQVPGGTPYFAGFSQLAVEPLLSHFGEKPERLIPAAGNLGGKKVNRGDAAVTIDAFSRVPVIVVLQKGDEEFPPTASVLFDSTIPDYLPSEDIRILREIIASKLIKFI